jgi:hypothetical protein
MTLTCSNGKFMKKLLENPVSRTHIQQSLDTEERQLIPSVERVRVSEEYPLLGFSAQENTKK